MNLYHYFDDRSGPFHSLSEISIEEAKILLEHMKIARPDSQCAARHAQYVEYRQNCEEILRREFKKKGGVLQRKNPHYMVVEHSPWLSTWFEQSAMVAIPIEEFDLRTLSFTYGDSMPTFSPTINDGREYRHQIYTYEEILEMIEKYGLPQEWNADGSYGPERYIEVQVWSDWPVDQYRTKGDGMP